MAGPARLLIEAFETRFKSTPDVFRAPGRVNLIGEHTDYNQGFVLPVALDMACYAASARNRDGAFRVYSLNLNESREWPVTCLPELCPAGDWSDYVIGVARQIPQPRGRDVMVYSTVPVGAGLSSSAALEVSSALASGWDLESGSRLELAQLCRRAENEFVGLPSGIMDQYVCVFGQKHAAVKIDCRSLEHEMVRLPPDVAIVAVDSTVKHALGQSAYRERVAECRRAEEILGIALRDADETLLERIKDPVVRKRARHVITEDRRVERFVEAASRGNVAEMGRLLIASHRSLQYDYEVSCEELDFLVDTALAVDGVYGARMTGGGFGGCTVNLLQPSAVERFQSTLRAAYVDRFGRDPVFYPVHPAEGASRLS